MAQVKQRNSKNNSNSKANKSNSNKRNTSRRNNSGYKQMPEAQGQISAETKKELVIWCTLILSIILLLCVFNLCGPLNNVLGTFIFGLFGILAYVFPFLLFFSIGIYYLNRNNKTIVRKVVFSWLLFLVVTALVQMLVNDKVENVFECYTLGYETHFGGGFIGGCISLGFSYVIGNLATAIILIILAIMLFVFITGKFIASFIVDRSVDRYSEYSRERKEYREIKRQHDEEIREERREQRREKRRQKSYVFPVEDVEASESNIVNPVVDDNPSENITASAENNMSVIDNDNSIGNDNKDVSEDNISIVTDSSENMQIDNRKEAKTDLPIYEQELISKFGNAAEGKSKDVQKLLERAYEDISISDDGQEHDFMDDVSISNMYSRNDDFSEENNSTYENDFMKESHLRENHLSEENAQSKDMPQSDVQDDISESTFDDDFAEEEQSETYTSDVLEHSFLDNTDEQVEETEFRPVSDYVYEPKPVKENLQSVEEKMEGNNGDDVNIEMPPEPIPYIFPSIDLLSKPPKSDVVMSDEDLKNTARKLQDCLKSFKVDVTMKEIICGPTVTRYELQPALGTRVKKITELENDIKLYLAAKDLRIEAPIPGKSAVGIEVPNSENVTVSVREMLDSKEFKNHKSNISFAVGKDIGGHIIVADIKKMPHLLIAGSTGSGKSVCINTIVMSLIYKADPNDVKMIMIDPKVVELSIYNGLPHLCIPVVTDPKRAAAALHWAVVEMDERYEKFANLGVRDLEGFNRKLETLTENPHLYRKMPQIVIIIDELADLMMVASHEVENSICRLAQKARACGIHLIIATQRPSVDVITGLIKANVPSRIAFAVSSQIDSRTILDSVGAEKLLGKGDMLFFPQGMAKPVRVQGAFVSDSEVARVTDFIKAQYDLPVYDSSIDTKISDVQFAANQSASGAASVAETDDNGRDEKFEEAGRFIIEKQKASIGTLQRVFKIGFNRGARIMDQLCEAGVVSEEDGKKPRNILMTMEEFEQMLEEGR